MFDTVTMDDNDDDDGDDDNGAAADSNGDMLDDIRQMTVSTNIAIKCGSFIAILSNLHNDIYNVIDRRHVKTKSNTKNEFI